MTSFTVYLQECLLDKKTGFYVRFVPIGNVKAATPQDALQKARSVKKNKQYGHHIAVGMAQVQETLQ